MNTFANQLGNKNAVSLLNETLLEEKQTSDKLGKLAMKKVNRNDRELVTH